MPKMKTNKGAAKRFKAVANGFKNKRAYRNHILTKRSTKQKRNLRATTFLGRVKAKLASRLLKKS